MLSLRERFRRGQVVWGPSLKLSDPAVVEILGRVGFHFVFIDQEHATLNEETVEHLIRAALLSEIAPVVRVPENRPAAISKALDMGALGVVVPHIATSVDAEQAVRAAKFYPLGDRGVDPTVRAGGYSILDPDDYYKNSNEETAIILEIEGIEGVDRVDEIASIPGTDAIFVGPYDLSQSMGMPGQVKNAELRSKMMTVMDACKRANVISGTFVGSLEDFEYWLGAGVQYILYSTDNIMFASECRRVAEMLETSCRAKGSVRRG